MKVLTSPELLSNQEVLQLPADSFRPLDDCSGIETAEDDLGFSPEVKSYLSMPHLTDAPTFPVPSLRCPWLPWASPMNGNGTRAEAVEHHFCFAAA